jgi:hypothetical protein
MQVNDDVFSKLEKALTMIRLAKGSTVPLMIQQHLGGAERILEAVLRTSDDRG